MLLPQTPYTARSLRNRTMPRSRWTQGLSTAFAAAALDGRPSQRGEGRLPGDLRVWVWGNTFRPSPPDLPGRLGSAAAPSTEALLRVLAPWLLSTRRDAEAPVTGSRVLGLTDCQLLGGHKQSRYMSCHIAFGGPCMWGALPKDSKDGGSAGNSMEGLTGGWVDEEGGDGRPWARVSSAGRIPQIRNSG